MAGHKSMYKYFRPWYQLLLGIRRQRAGYTSGAPVALPASVPRSFRTCRGLRAASVLAAPVVAGGCHCRGGRCCRRFCHRFGSNRASVVAPVPGRSSVAAGWVAAGAAGWQAASSRAARMRVINKLVVRFEIISS
jgi:hypothetical protein